MIETTLRIGSTPLRIEDVVAVAEGRAAVVLDGDPAFRARLEQSVEALRQRIVQGPPVYGVTTGFGASCETEVPSDLANVLPLQLLRYHGCGTGALLSPEASAAVLVVRLASLATGYSAVRPLLLERIAQLLHHRILPCIPSEGSVGASGDLTPLSYVAAVLVGERDVFFRDSVRPALEALSAVDLPPLELGPKESLALMNGTSVMTALAALGHVRAARLGRFAAALTAMAVDVVQGQASHFDARIFGAKPHPGQTLAADFVREDLGVGATPAPIPGRVQNSYSLRCAPHVLGVLFDALALFRGPLETEINGANDNPLVDPETGDVLHGGNFYGGHVAFVADATKTAVANVADLLDRQLALLTQPRTSGGLPENLVRRSGPDRVAHHGFKAMEITASALAAEALKMTMPASVFSRSTEGHNQDKVSMGTIAARDFLRVLELTETVAVVHLLTLCQAADLRGPSSLGPRARALHTAVRAEVPTVDADRAMDRDIATVLDLYRRGRLPFGEVRLP